MRTNLRCLILAGGLGTRLAPIISDLPKPMAQVAGRPFLAYLLHQVQAAGCTDVVLSIGHKGHLIEDYFGDGNHDGLQLRYSREPQPLGTGGALALARPLLGTTTCLVLNGDSYCPLDLHALLAHHQARGACATIAATQVPDPAPYGQLVLGGDDTIIHFREKGESKAAGYVNAGIYLLEQSVFDLIPPTVPCSLERAIFPLLAGQGLYAFRQTTPFIDIGTPTTWQLAQTILPELRKRALNGYS